MLARSLTVHEAIDPAGLRSASKSSSFAPSRRPVIRTWSTPERTTLPRSMTTSMGFAFLAARVQFEVAFAYAVLRDERSGNDIRHLEAYVDGLIAVEGVRRSAVGASGTGRPCSRGARRAGGRPGPRGE